MALTTLQLQQLKTAILAETDPTFVQYRNDGNNAGMAGFYNTAASPQFWVYRNSIPSAEIGRTVSYVAVAAMTTANLDRVNNFLNLNPSSFNGRDDIKTFLSDTFSGALGGAGQSTRDALDLMLRRVSTRAEKLFATGTGSTVAPATMSFEGALTSDDIRAALAS